MPWAEQSLLRAAYVKDWAIVTLCFLQMHLNPSNTVFDAKRLIGREFAEKAVQDDIANMHWPFLVRRNEAGRPYFAGNVLFLQALLLSQMRFQAQGMTSTFQMVPD